MFNYILYNLLLVRIKDLEVSLQEEDITLKGFCKQTWALLQEYASIGVTATVTDILDDISAKKIDEVYILVIYTDYCLPTR